MLKSTFRGARQLKTQHSARFILNPHSCVRTYSSDVSTQSKKKTEEFQKQFYDVLNANDEGKLADFVKLYHELKAKHLDKLTLQHYNQILASCAPKKLMLKWYKPYKDYVDMYYEAGKFIPEERLEEANRVLRDIETSPLSLRPDIVTYNTMMKVQLSGGISNVVNVFETFNQLQRVSQRNRKTADVISFTTLLRACSLLERVDVAEEIYSFVVHSFANRNIKSAEQSQQEKWQVQTESELPIHFFNTMLDVYAEVGSPYAETFFRQMLQQKLPVDGVTFNTYAKSCIFRDDRVKLVEIPELMRVEGVLQRDLSHPVRAEINAAYNKFTAPLKFKEENQQGRFQLNSGFTSPDDPNREDFFEDLRNVRPWGRYVDLKDSKFLKLLEYAQLDKFTVDSDFIAKTTKINEHPSHYSAVPKRTSL